MDTGKRPRIPLKSPSKKQSDHMFCAVVGEKGKAFSVRIDASESVDDLKKLFLTKNNNDTWLESSTVDVQKLKKGKQTALIEALTHEDNELQEEFGLEEVLEGMPEPRIKQIHVLVTVPRAGQEQLDEERARKKPITLTVIDKSRTDSIAATLDIDRWQVGGVALDICYVEPDFSTWFYVWKETQDIIKIFNNHMEKKLSTVFVGTPGVGKSMLVVLFTFFMALRQQKRVVLFRKRKQEGISVLYLDAKKKRYWRENVGKLKYADHLLTMADELCLDGFLHDDVKTNFGRLARFRLLATSVQYPMKNDDTPVLRRCLVPFCSELDLKAVGALFQWTDHKIKKRYYYSGGNLRDFMSEEKVAIDSVNQAVRVAVAEVLNTQNVLGSDRQSDRLRVTSVQASKLNCNNQNMLDEYTTPESWCCVITSEYALRKLGTIIKPSYYQELWSKGRMLGDDGLMGIAFENYVSP